MDPLGKLPSRLGRGAVRAWSGLAEGWRQLLSRSGESLTHFDAALKSSGTDGEFPSWGLVPVEAWETAQSIIVRVELPGMSREDIDVELAGTFVRIRGEKRSGGEAADRRYHLMERAFGRFERRIPLPARVEEDTAEVSYRDGVVTVIVRKTEPSPPRSLEVR